MTGGKKRRSSEAEAEEALRPARGQGAQTVHDSLRRAILDLSLPPGSPLDEVSLAAEFDMSRTPVREALARLASEGLIAADGRSFMVPVLSDADVDEIYELRGLLEPAALAQAATAAHPPGALDAIARAFHDAEAAERTGDAEAFIEANARFHAAWHALVANRRLLRAIDLSAGHVRFLRVLTLNTAAARKAALPGMRSILASLRKRDAARAAQVMAGHLRVAREHLRIVLDDIARESAAVEPAAESR